MSRVATAVAALVFVGSVVSTAVGAGVVHLGEGFFGCRTRPLYEEALQHMPSRERDDEAFMELFVEGSCLVLEKGAAAEVVNTDSGKGLVRVRLRDSGLELWTDAQAMAE